MSGAIGHSYIYNIIILFIVIVFAFLTGTLIYYKAFKVNNKIVGTIEKFEGYNELAKDQIEKDLGTIGYRIGDSKACPNVYKEMTFVSIVNNEEHYKYCIYIDTVNPASGTYYQYGVLTYMSIDLPIIKNIQLPIFTKTNRIYKFTNSKNP